MFAAKKFLLHGCSLVSKNGWGILKGSIKQELTDVRLSIELAPMFGVPSTDDRRAAYALREKLGRVELKVGATLEVDCACVLAESSREAKDGSKHKDTFVEFCVIDFNVVAQGNGDVLKFSQYVKAQKAEASETKVESETEADKAEAEDVARVAD